MFSSLWLWRFLNENLKMGYFFNRKPAQMGWTLVEQGWTWLNIVKHIQGGQFGPVGPQKSVTKEPQKRPKKAFFGSKMAIFGCFWHPPVALSRGLNGFNISPWMCSIMFKQLWALFSFFWRIGGNQSKIRCFGRFGGLQGPCRAPPGTPKGVPDTKKGGRISQPL